MKSILINLLSLFFVTTTLLAQHQNVVIATSYNPNETSVAIDAKNVNRMVVGANIDRFFYSENSGLSWIEESISSPYYVAGDPALTFDTTGAILYCHLSYPNSGYWLDRIVCQRSEDNGVTWSSASVGNRPPKQQDKEWIVVDPNNNNVYITWTEFDEYGSELPTDSTRILFSKSVDGGLSFTDAIQLNKVSGDCIDDDMTTEGAVPCVGPNGEIYVSWSGPEGIVFDRSLDFGATWLDEDIPVDPQIGGWAQEVDGIMRVNGMPVTCCDVSGGENHGTIYINYTDETNGSDDIDVWLKKSTDGGDTWSEAIRVNDDPPGKQQFFTWMTVDQVTGYLWFVFYDRRDYDDVLTDVYMACSRDGGETFINFKVSEEPFYSSAGTFFGDYTGVAAHDDVVRPVWTAFQPDVPNKLQIVTALVDVSTVGFEKSMAPIAEMRAYPNPFTISSTCFFRLKRATTVTLQVYDATGRLVETIYENKELYAGKHTALFSPQKRNLASGAYYFVLTKEGAVEHKKLLYLK